MAKSESGSPNSPRKRNEMKVHHRVQRARSNKQIKTTDREKNANFKFPYAAPPLDSQTKR